MDYKKLKILVIIEGIIFILGFTGSYILYINNRNIVVFLVLIFVLLLVIGLSSFLVIYLSRRHQEGPKEEKVKEEKVKKTKIVEEIQDTQSPKLEEEIIEITLDDISKNFSFIKSSILKKQIISAIFSSSYLIIDTDNLNDATVLCTNIQKMFKQEKNILDCTGKTPKDILSALELKDDLYNIVGLKNITNMQIEDLYSLTSKCIGNSYHSVIQINDKEIDLKNVCFILIKEDIEKNSELVMDNSFYVELSDFAIDYDPVYDSKLISYAQYKHLSDKLSAINLISEDLYRKLDKLYEVNYQSPRTNRYNLNLEKIVNLLLKLELDEDEIITSYEMAKLSFLRNEGERHA